MNLKGFLFLIVLMFSFSFCLNAREERGVYGVDNRLDVKNAHPSYAHWAQSVASQIDFVFLLNNNNGKDMTITGSTLEKSFAICPTERFAQQISSAECTGFLVAPDLLVTAGHCMLSNRCVGYVWVFGYFYEGEALITSSYDNIYFCKKVLENGLEEGGSGDDYAIVKLDRKVRGRQPLPYRKSAELDSSEPLVVGDPLVVIGSPSGLPIKVADGGEVRSIPDGLFVSNLDTFGGNSGSPIFNQKTGHVEGILISGDTDYYFDEENLCNRVKNFTSEGGDGEVATSMSVIRTLDQIIKKN